MLPNEPELKLDLDLPLFEEVDSMLEESQWEPLKPRNSIVVLYKPKKPKKKKKRMDDDEEFDRAIAVDYKEVVLKEHERSDEKIRLQSELMSRAGSEIGPRQSMSERSGSSENDPAGV